jgi:hypothetical protein
VARCPAEPHAPPGLSRIEPSWDSTCEARGLLGLRRRLGARCQPGSRRPVHSSLTSPLATL